MTQANYSTKHIIVAGVPRSGSTSLFTYLSNHPDICPSVIKETQFFLPALYDEPVVSLSSYLDFFTACPEREYFMEASPSYFFGGEKVAKVIYDYLGENVKLIFLIREPIERLESCFFYDIMVGAIPKSAVFEKFLEAASIDSWRSVESGYYADYLKGWFNYYGDSIKVLFYDDLKNDPLHLMEGLCEWLSISPKYYKNFEFTKENRRIMYKSKKFHLFALSLNIRFEKILRRQQNLKRFIRGIYHRFNEAQVQAEEGARSVMQAETKMYLKEVFEPHNEELYKLLVNNNQTVSGWLADYK